MAFSVRESEHFNGENGAFRTSGGCGCIKRLGTGHYLAGEEGC